MISYGGIPLVQPQAETLNWIAERMHIADVFGFFRPRWLGDPDFNPGAHFNWFLSRPIKINSFWHPWGASRWGYACVVADENMFEEISGLVYPNLTGTITNATGTPIVITSANHGLVTGNVVVVNGVKGNTAANGTWTITVLTANTFSLNGSASGGAYTSGGVWNASSYVSLPFIMDDDTNTGNSIKTNLWMLPPIPFTKIYETPLLSGYFLILVDDRYFWWQQQATINVVENTTTWSQLFTEIANGLNITLNVDTINAAYLNPSAVFNKENQYLPMLLDLAASSVGHRVVRTLGNQFYTRTALSALALQSSQANSFEKVGGGSFDFGEVTA